ncbi:MAG: RNA pyrophosphohydrolase [Gammaproteobacteria bacterium]
MIDAEGYRENVGIVICNDAGRVFWGRRVGMNAWQFPQGGIDGAETPIMAMLRELREEVGLEPGDVEVLGSTQDWLHYRLPKRFVRSNQVPVCIGQKQIWFAVRLLSSESAVNLRVCNRPEFDTWRWVPYWRPISEVVSFKRRVYKRALTELAPLVPGCRKPASAMVSTPAVPVQ